MTEQKSLQAGREYTNIRYSTDGGLTPAAPASAPAQPPVESPTGKHAEKSKSTLSLASVAAAPAVPLLPSNSNHVAVPKEKAPAAVKEKKNTPSRVPCDPLLPM